MAPTNFTLQDLHCFHTIDRELFFRLVVILRRDPAESLLVMALWLWLETYANFSNLIHKLVSLPNAMVNEMAKEAATCLKWLQSKVPPMPNIGEGDMPITALTMDRAISFPNFYQTRFTMISGIKNYLNNVCSIVFADILLQVLPGKLRCPLINTPIHVPGFPHPTFGAILVIPRTLDAIITNNVRQSNIWSLKPEAGVDDRTMFLTFSRGYPVTEDEVIELFNTNYGDCVENVRMVPPTFPLEHSLYARMVVRDVSTIDQILGRGPIAKFRINGKHVWARKYERRDQHHERF